MTAQQSLSQVWAESGGVTDPGAVKYANGWVAEIPTYQNFNYVLQTTTKNILAFARSNRWQWEDDIAYISGAKAAKGGVTYYCVTDHTNQDPELDTLGNYWSKAPTFGAHQQGVDSKKGMSLKNVSPPRMNFWDGNDLTLQSERPTICLTSNQAIRRNWLLSNISGFLCTVDVGYTTEPDGRNVAIGQPGVHKIYHEGNKPKQTDVANTIPTEPQDGKLYARRNGAWIEVTATTVSEAPPPPVSGAGQGWYNLSDGVTYIDVDDGNSSQWVPASPARTVLANTIEYDNGASGLSATTMQAAIDELASLHP